MVECALPPITSILLRSAHNTPQINNWSAMTNFLLLLEMCVTNLHPSQAPSTSSTAKVHSLPQHPPTYSQMLNTNTPLTKALPLPILYTYHSHKTTLTLCTLSTSQHFYLNIVNSYTLVGYLNQLIPLTKCPSLALELNAYDLIWCLPTTSHNN